LGSCFRREAILLSAWYKVRVGESNLNLVWYKVRVGEGMLKLL